MKVLIYGINGFLGGNVGSYLSQFYNIVGVGTTTELAQGLGDGIHKYYRYNGEDLFTKECPDIVIFCVSLDHNKSNENAINTIDVNLKIYAQVVEAMRKKLDWRGKLIYLSTAQVLQDGDVHNGNIDITNIYGLTHHYCEHLGRYYLPDRCYNIRLPNVVGIPSSQRANIWWNIIPDLLHKAITSGEMIVKSDGTPNRTFISVADFCLHIKNLISNDVAPGDYNIISDQKYSIAEVVTLIVAKLNEKGISYQLDLPSDFVANSIAELTPTPTNINILKLDKNQSLDAVILQFIEYITEQSECKQ
jgi:nucleoside-diphosphate-sugar epimerase